MVIRSAGSVLQGASLAAILFKLLPPAALARPADATSFDQKANARFILRGFYLSLLILASLLPVRIATAVPLVNGGVVSDSIAVGGEEDSHTFTANAGDSVVLSVAGSMPMRIELRNPSGNLIGTSTNIISGQMTQSGIYTVAARSNAPPQTGTYDLHFIKAPGANEHGVLPNGGTLAEVLSAGDIDSYSFTGNPGDQISVTATGNIQLRVEIWRPDGSLLSTSTSPISVPLNQSGVYTVGVRSNVVFQPGTYQITYTNNLAGTGTTTSRIVPFPIWALLSLGCLLFVTVVRRGARR